MDKLHTTVKGRRVFARNEHDKIIHNFADLADLIVKQDLPPKLLKDLGIKKTILQK